MLCWGLLSWNWCHFQVPCKRGITVTVDKVTHSSCSLAEWNLKTKPQIPGYHPEIQNSSDKATHPKPLLCYWISIEKVDSCWVTSLWMLVISWYYVVKYDTRWTTDLIKLHLNFSGPGIKFAFFSPQVCTLFGRSKWFEISHEYVIGLKY